MCYFSRELESWSLFFWQSEWVLRKPPLPRPGLTSSSWRSSTTTCLEMRMTTMMRTTMTRTTRRTRRMTSSMTMRSTTRTITKMMTRYALSNEWQWQSYVCSGQPGRHPGGDPLPPGRDLLIHPKPGDLKINSNNHDNNDDHDDDNNHNIDGTTYSRSLLHSLRPKRRALSLHAGRQLGSDIKQSILALRSITSAPPITCKYDYCTHQAERRFEERHRAKVSKVITEVFL